MEKLYFLLLGTTTAIAGLWFLWFRLNLVVTGTKTTGRVVDWERRGRRAFHPVIVFTAADGQEHQFTSNSGTSWKPARESYPVLYKRERPSHALVYTLLDFWLLPVIFFAFAAAGFHLFLR